MMAESYRHSTANMLTARSLSPRGIASYASMNSFQWTLVGISFIMVSCRLYARCIRSKNCGLDDLCIVIAMGLSIFGGICGIFFTHYGIGKHVWQLDSNQKSGASEWLYISILDSYIELFFVRLSIGIFTLRMLKQTRTRLRMAVFGILTLNLANTIMVVVVYGIWCRPIQGVWNKEIKATCLSGTVLSDSNRVFSVLSACIDVMLCCLPISIIWRLQLELKVKVNITIILLFGLMMCTCAILKAIYVNETSTDFTYVNVPATYCAVAEDNVGIMVSCLPGVRQFFLITRDDILIWMGKQPRRQYGKGIRPGITQVHGRRNPITSQPLAAPRSSVNDSDTASYSDNYRRQNGSVLQSEESISRTREYSQISA